MSNPDEVAALNETLDLLSDVEASAQLAEARNEVVRATSSRVTTYVPSTCAAETLN